MKIFINDFKCTPFGYDALNNSIDLLTDDELRIIKIICNYQLATGDEIKALEQEFIELYSVVNLTRLVALQYLTYCATGMSDTSANKYNGRKASEDLMTSLTTGYRDNKNIKKVDTRPIDIEDLQTVPTNSRLQHQGSDNTDNNIGVNPTKANNALDSCISIKNAPNNNNEFVDPVIQFVAGVFPKKSI